MNCPQCASDQWKLASLVYSEGTARTSSFTVGGGALVGEGDALPAMGAGLSVASRQTELAKKAAPPRRRIYIPPRAPAPIATGLARKGLVVAGVGLAGLMALVTLGYPMVALPFALIVLFGLATMVRALWLSLVGEEAAAARRFRAQARADWEAEQEAAMARYRDTRICLRCGEFYLPQ